MVEVRAGAKVADRAGTREVPDGTRADPDGAKAVVWEEAGPAEVVVVMPNRTAISSP